jgi:hypothetical protein
MKKQLDLLMLFETPVREYYYTKMPIWKVTHGILGDVLFENNPNNYDVGKLIRSYGTRLIESFTNHLTLNRYNINDGVSPGYDFMEPVTASYTLAEILDVIITNLPKPLDYHLVGVVRKNNPLLKHLLEIYTSEEYQTLRIKAKGAIC